MAINKQGIIEKLKRNQGIMNDDQDLIVADIVDDTVEHYLAIASQLKGERVLEVPDNHSFIISDVASRRYVRRGSEGMESEQVDGYRATYADPQQDFESYMRFLEDEFATGEAEGGRLTFY